MDNRKEDCVIVSSNHRYPSKWTQPLINKLFSQSEGNGIIGLQYKNETVRVGSGEYRGTIAPPSFLRLILMLMKPAYRIPEYYTKGYWSCEHGKLGDFLETMSTPNNSKFHQYYKRLSVNPIRDFIVYRLFPLKVKEKIALHYNSSPKFMKLILGEKLEYTCAFFESESDDLSSAQENKIDKIVQRLAITGKDKVLDLGCGWGQIAESIALKTGSTITGVNISTGQVRYAKECASSNASFVQTDYESFKPQMKFNKIYSIGMLEHIGRGKLDTYFNYIGSMLEQEGMALVHCIVNREPGSTNSWIDDIVFPGAHIPQLSEVFQAIEKTCLDVQDVYFHDSVNYYKTLSAWEDNFRQNAEKLERLAGTSLTTQDREQVMRIWEFYLCCSKMLFSKHAGSCYNVQIVLSRSGRQ